MTFDTDGAGCRIPVGSAVVVLDFYDWADGQTVISLRSDVLREVEVTSTNRPAILDHLNTLNHIAKFGKFYLDAVRRTIVLEHDLLGDNLQANELLNAVRTVGRHADRTDDDLLAVIGTGRRAADIDSLDDDLPDDAAPMSDG